MTTTLYYTNICKVHNVNSQTKPEVLSASNGIRFPLHNITVSWHSASATRPT